MHSLGRRPGHCLASRKGLKVSGQQKQTPGCNRASADTKTDTPIIGGTAYADKSFADLKIAFAFRGHELRRVSLPNGTAVYRCQRWGHVRDFPADSTRDVIAFLLSLGGKRL